MIKISLNRNILLHKLLHGFKGSPRIQNTFRVCSKFLNTSVPHKNKKDWFIDDEYNQTSAIEAIQKTNVPLNENETPLERLGNVDYALLLQNSGGIDVKMIQPKNIPHIKKVFITECSNKRHLKSLAEEFRQYLKRCKEEHPDSFDEALSVKGEAQDEWLVINIKDYWFHFLSHEKRLELNLEEYYLEDSNADCANEETELLTNEQKIEKLLTQNRSCEL